jgi:broad specificity phosphatase PhoE
MLTMYLVRHGETEENRAGVLQGITPGHLTPLGREQAEALGESLKDVSFDAVVSSPLQRAVDTTNIIMRGRPAVDIDLCDLLMERDWGSLTLWKCADAKALEKFPDDVETLEHGMQRARQFVNLMLGRYDGKRILCVGHGFIDRCILAQIYGIDKSRVQRMENAECRIVEVRGMTGGCAPMSADEASAN